MMAIPMENKKENSSKELAQHLFDKNVELNNKRRKAAQARVPSDPNAWQQIRENYEAIVLEDHAFSEKHDIEVSLWQLHYGRIEELRALLNASLASARNGKGSVRSGADRVTKIRSQFKTFLSETTGFYHDFILKIRAKYGLPLGYSSEYPDNQITVSKAENKSSDVKKGLISCHRCLIYLGDLSRYKVLYEGESKARDFTAASSYYMQASSLCPSNGNPHHQLAILAGYANDELLSIYRYFRSLAIENPFITARDNLTIAFEKNRQNYNQLLGDGKAILVERIPSKTPGKGRGRGGVRSSFKDVRLVTPSVTERAPDNSELFKSFITRFVRLNGILFTRTSLETFVEVFSTVKSDLLELLSSGENEDLNFGDTVDCRLAIVRMIAILIYTVHNANKEKENQSYAEILQRSVLLQNALTATFEFMGCMLERCHQLNDPSSSYLLPGVMVFIEWLACRPDVAVSTELEEKQLSARSFFWNNCIVLLNKLLSNGYIFVNGHEEGTFFSNMGKYDENGTANCLALSEDFELRGFLPLLPAQLILDFSRKHSFGGDGIGGNKEKFARIQRIVAAGKALADVVRLGQEGVYFDAKINKFVIGTKPHISDDHVLTSPLEPNLNGNLQVSVRDGVSLGHVTKLDVFVGAEDEDEDEVIVFRPPINEKHIDEFSINLTSAELLTPVSRTGKNGFVKENVSSVGHDTFFIQNELNARSSTTIVNATSQCLQPVQPSVSKWPVEHTPNLNGLAHLTLMENGSSLKSELQDQFEVSQPAARSLPYPKFIGTSGHNNPSHVSEVAVTSKFDSTLSGAAADGQHVNPSSVMPSGLNKNAVSRPVRYLGPPPGFGSVPSKVGDESSKMTLKIEDPPLPQMDYYSWLNGYPSSSLNQSVGFTDSIHQVRPTFHSVNKSNGSMGMAGFPFPGKQVSSQVQAENQKDWLDCHFSEHMMPYEEQKPQHHTGNQQRFGTNLQYHAPPGDGRFFV